MPISFLPSFASSDDGLDDNSDQRVYSYRGVEVTYDPERCATEATACYTTGGDYDKTINFKKPSGLGILDKIVLLHEHAHHIHISLMNKKDYDIWLKISNFDPSIQKIMNKYSINENCYVTEYAKTNYKEDFAETYMQSEIQGLGKIKDYCDVKRHVAYYLYKKYYYE